MLHVEQRGHNISRVNFYWHWHVVLLSISFLMCCRVHIILSTRTKLRLHDDSESSHCRPVVSHTGASLLSPPFLLWLWRKTHSQNNFIAHNYNNNIQYCIIQCVYMRFYASECTTTFIFDKAQRLMLILAKQGSHFLFPR